MDSDVGVLLQESPPRGAFACAVDIVEARLENAERGQQDGTHQAVHV